MRTGVEFRIVGVDEFPVVTGFHGGFGLGDEPVEIVVRKARGAAAEIAVVVRVHDRAVRHNVRFSGQRIEKRCAAVKARRRYAALLQRVARRARLERQGRGNRIGLGKPGEPSGKPVLGRRQAGKGGGDGARRGGREDRSHPAREVGCKGAAGSAAGKVVVPKAVDDDKNDVLCAGKFFGGQGIEGRMQRTATPRCGAARDQVQQSAAGVIRVDAIGVHGRVQGGAMLTEKALLTDLCGAETRAPRLPSEALSGW